MKFRARLETVNNKLELVLLKRYLVYLVHDSFE